MDKSQSRLFPLTVAYEFLKQNGLTNEADTIKQSQAVHENHKYSLKRGRIIVLLEKNNLLASFIANCWPVGATPKGRSEMTKCKRLYERFLASSAQQDE